MRPILVLSLLVSACGSDIRIAPSKDEEPDVVDSEPALPVGTPDIEVSPAELRFGALMPDCEATPKEITVANVGDADLEVTAVTLRGPDKAVYTLKVDPFTVQAGKSQSFAVGFTPSEIQTFGNALVEVESNDPDEDSVTVELDGAGSESAYREEIFTQGEAGAVDVLFSIDYSGSMSNEISALGNRFPTFIQSFINLGLDYQIGVITADPACPELQGPVKVITPATPDPVQAFLDATALSGCGGEAAFGATKNALTEPYLSGANAGFLRADATLAVVTLSDEPEQSGISPGSYVQWLTSLKGDPARVSFSGIVGPAQAPGFLGIVCRGEVEAAPQYHNAIRQSGGVWGDICKLELVPFLTHLSYVAAGLEFSFELSEVPLSYSPSAITVTVDGVVVPYSAVNGWTFDAANNAIELHGTAIPEPGKSVVIAYPIDGDC